MLLRSSRCNQSSVSGFECLTQQQTILLLQLKLTVNLIDTRVE